MQFQIRPYHPTDLTALYEICLRTGDSGTDASSHYKDPNLLGHYYAAPYAILEPELAFILLHSGKPCGYVLGTKDTGTFGKRCELDWFPPLRARYPMPNADDISADASMIRSIYEGHSLENDPVDYPAHLHIDILPEGQGQGWGKKLIQRLLIQLELYNIPAVHLGVGNRNTNAIGFYEHVGFHKIEEYASSTTYGIDLSKHLSN